MTDPLDHRELHMWLGSPLSQHTNQNTQLAHRDGVLTLSRNILGVNPLNVRNFDYLYVSKGNYLLLPTIFHSQISGRVTNITTGPSYFHITSILRYPITGFWSRLRMALDPAKLRLQ